MPAGRAPEGLAVATFILAARNPRRRLSARRRQLFFALEQRQPGDVLAVEFEEVKGEIDEAHRAAVGSLLRQLEPERSPRPDARRRVLRRRRRSRLSASRAPSRRRLPTGAAGREYGLCDPLGRFSYDCLGERRMGGERAFQLAASTCRASSSLGPRRSACPRKRLLSVARLIIAPRDCLSRNAGMTVLPFARTSCPRSGLAASSNAGRARGFA
jgi:hypothetical protein